MNQERMSQAMIGIGIVLMIVAIIGLVTAGDDESTVTPSDGGGADSSVASTTTTTTTVAATTTTTTVAPTTTTTTTVAPTTTTTTTTSTTLAPETVAEFFDAYVAAFAAEDTSFLFGRLNQAALDRYGADQCEAYLVSVAGTLGEVELRSEGTVGDWDYLSSDQSTLITGAHEVEIERTVNGQTVIQAVHWKLVDGRFTWFTDCGDPL